AHELTHVVQQGKANGPSLNRQPEEQLTRRQIARDNHLRRLAVWPREALDEWRSLSEGDRMTVVMYMIGNYGADFATQFNNNAKEKRRREPVTNVTNVNQTPQQLMQRGYRFVVTMGGIEKWVRPNGDEFWYIVPSQSRPPDNPPPGPQPPPPQPASNPPRYNPSADPVRLFGRERQVRAGATIMGQRGRAVQHEDGTIVLHPEGSNGHLIYRQSPGGSAYEFYGEDGEKVENVFIVVETDDVFGGTGAATP
ncbi:MAG: hypothetical protein H0W08_06925, partial [Acidobacteria bacterium]|nr:hypothetical protein [Acidobacteriota bacterium]